MMFSKKENMEKPRTWVYFLFQCTILLTICIFNGLLKDLRSHESRGHMTYMSF